MMVPDVKNTMGVVEFQYLNHCLLLALSVFCEKVLVLKKRKILEVLLFLVSLSQQIFV